MARLVVPPGVYPMTPLNPAYRESDYSEDRPELLPLALGQGGQVRFVLK